MNLDGPLGTLLLSRRKSLPHQATPFKFGEMWFHHPNFMEAVKSTWKIPSKGNPQSVLAHKLKILEQNLKK